jgi:Lon protease-like protein
MKTARIPGGRSIPATDSEGQSYRKKLRQDSTASMSDDGQPLASLPRLRLGANEDARALVRLVQCPKCSLPFKGPVTLPCGHSICRTCLPTPHLRENISYPNTPDRLNGVICPIEGCFQEHPEADCSVDVCLLKVMESVHAVVESCRPMIPPTTQTRVWGIIDRSKSTESWDYGQEKQLGQILPGGRLLSTFDLAQLGQLDYRSDAGYESHCDIADEKAVDEELLGCLREATHKELDCHVCYNMMYDPVTTPCGHTFCRKCLARVLDHSTHCPMCRRTLPIPPSLDRQSSNVRLVSLLQSVCPDLVATRAEAVEAEEHGEMGAFDTRLFVCTLAFPSMPTFLHIFEPRYRLMIRRTLEGNRQFGMLMYNQLGLPQADLGVVNFKEYGTMLRILNVHMLPDGRSLVETRGLYRFRVRAHGTLDGYVVGRVDRVEDVSLAEEERLEAEDTTSQIPLVDSPMSGMDGRRSSTSASQPTEIGNLSTQQLLAAGLDFIQKMRAHSAPWLHQRIIEVHGGPPDDAALFPYWFACVIPIMDEEKYKLLQTSSVRERLKIVVGWIRRIETQRW